MYKIYYYKLKKFFYSMKERYFLTIKKDFIFFHFFFLNKVINSFYTINYISFYL